MIVVLTIVDRDDRGGGHISHSCNSSVAGDTGLPVHCNSNLHWASMMPSCTLIGRSVVPGGDGCTGHSCGLQCRGFILVGSISLGCC
jgi:hypothetical protein